MYIVELAVKLLIAVTMDPIWVTHNEDTWATNKIMMFAVRTFRSQQRDRCSLEKCKPNLS